jgi:hypothetical protein
MIGDRWNVSDDEVTRRYPCDEFVAAPTLQAWRGVTVRTTPEVLWPWVAQIRLAPYSYDWIDNLGRRSPQHLHFLRSCPARAIDSSIDETGDGCDSLVGALPLGRRPRHGSSAVTQPQDTCRT